MKRLDWIVLCICVICLYAVIQIRLGCFWFIGSIENADAVNSIIEGLSYSYIAAYLFYVLTSFLPINRRKRKLKPIIRNKVQRIGSKNIRNILLEFARETELESNYRDTVHTREILQSKNWDEEVPLIKKFRGIPTTYFRYTAFECQEIRERVADIINRYKNEMTDDEFVILEDFSESSFISLILSLSSFPAMTVNSGRDSLIADFVKMQNKFMEVEKVFGIK